MNYDKMIEEITLLCEDCPYPLANLSNTIAVIFNTLPDINWSGVYFSEGDVLSLGVFQGKVACTEIPFSRGVCGAAAREMRTQRVDDVHKFPGHIACDAASRSEIVIPIISDGELIGVLDIDSPRLSRFDEEDERGLSIIADHIAQCLSSSRKHSQYLAAKDMGSSPA